MRDELLQRLFSMGEASYRDFQSTLIPTLARESILGVRQPKLRALARDMRKRGEAAGFLAALPHFYYEENALHALLLNPLRDVDALMEGLEDFLPHVDNWAICDMLRPKCFASRPAALEARIESWMQSAHTYTLRFAIGMRMCHYLGEGFLPEQAGRIVALRHADYYVNMMRAWYFAEGMAKRPADFRPCLLEDGGALDPWTRKKAVQKALESRRVDEADKAALRAWRKASRFL